MPDERTRLHWIEAQESPYGIRVLDCRELTHGRYGWLSVTDDPKVAETFAALRRSDGTQHKDLYPLKASSYPVDLAYPHVEARPDGPIFQARQMEDKWDIYLHEGRLYLARSWTGRLVLVAGVAFGASFTVAWIAAPDLGGPLDPPFPVREFDFLVKSHLYRRRVPNPVPAGYSDDALDVARFSMHQYGRWASYASFEDTTQFNPWSG